MVSCCDGGVTLGNGFKGSGTRGNETGTGGDLVAQGEFAPARDQIFYLNQDLRVEEECPDFPLFQAGY